MSTIQHVLGIETSCDETGVALFAVRSDAANGPVGRLVGHRLYSQAGLHALYGGVVPELASRDHVRKLLPLVQELLAAHALRVGDLSGVAYTQGPGLVGALLAGAATAQGLAFGLGVAAVGVHHLEGHLLAPLLDTPRPRVPFLALLVSGGHTMLVEVAAVGRYTILGETLDDAAGEAFDKTAKLLGVPYPGGAALAQLADEWTGDEQAQPFRFPRPMTDRPGLDFSFSGLKTQALLALQRHGGRLEPESLRQAFAAAFQAAIVETLVIKCERALAQTGLERLVVAGGVGANRALRLALAQRLPGRVYYPRIEFCTDNGAMIALAGAMRLAAGERDPDLGIRARARWPLHELDMPAASLAVTS